MGVKGLTTFVKENHRKFLKNEKVHDCSLVIDGFGLVYHLYFGSNLDVKCGGEFAALVQVTDQFFTNLKQCNIKPYVIFDGPIDDEKLCTVLDRLQDRVKDVQRVLQGNNRARMLPIFSVDVLLHYLWSHDVPHAVSMVEADREIAAVANFLNCPVVSEDSDYFIYDVKNGYIPFGHFYWDNVWVDKSPWRKSIVCHKYHISYMCELYKLPKGFLPYLSILLGNDWVDNRTFNQLISNLPQVRSSSKQKQSRQVKPSSRVDTVLNWLSLKSGRESGIVEKMINSLPHDRRDFIRSKINFCLTMYTEVLDISKTLQALGVQEYMADDCEDPYAEIKSLVRKRLAHPFAMNLLESNYIALPVVMSDPKKPSPHTPASDIRALIYRILLRKFRFRTSGAEFLFIQEYDKVDMFYKKSRSVSVFTSLCPMCDQHHSLDDGCKMATVDGTVVRVYGFSTSDLLYKTLGLHANLLFKTSVVRTVESVYPNIGKSTAEYLSILLVSMLIWVKKTSPNSDFVHAMILTIAFSLNKTAAIEDRLKSKSLHQTASSKRKKESFIPHAEYVSEAQFVELFGDHGIEAASGVRERIESRFNVELLHSSSSWFCILNAAILLHQVVESPRSKFAMHEFFASSKLFHDIHARTTRFKKPSGKFKEDPSVEIISGCLETLPSVKTLFQALIDFITQQ